MENGNQSREAMMERRMKHAAYYEASQPIIREMTDILSIYSSYTMVVSNDGVRTIRGSLPAREQALYDQCQDTLVTLQRLIFERPFAP